MKQDWNAIYSDSVLAVAFLFGSYVLAGMGFPVWISGPVSLWLLIRVLRKVWGIARIELATKTDGGD